jgi:hypothetical protein
MADQFKILTGSTNGLPIKVHATATVGTTIHTAVAGTNDFDFVTLWAHNNNTSGTTRTLTLEFGGVSTDDNIFIPIPAKVGPILVLDRFPLRNSLVIGAFADVADEVFITGSAITIDLP